MDSSLVGSILQSAGSGTAIIVVLLLLGIISPKAYTTRVEAESDKWYKAWEDSSGEVSHDRVPAIPQVSDRGGECDDGDADGGGGVAVRVRRAPATRPPDPRDRTHADD